MNNRPQEQIEKPTQKRIQDAKNQGNIARSRELTVTLMIYTVVILLLVSAGDITKSLYRLTTNCFKQNPTQFTVLDASLMLKNLLINISCYLMPIVLVYLLAIIIGASVFGGLQFKLSLLSPKLNRLNPKQLFQRITSSKILYDVNKILIKFLILITLLITLLRYTISELHHIDPLIDSSSIHAAIHLFSHAMLCLLGSLLLFTLIDIPYQYYQWKKSLSMSRAEIEQELKEQNRATVKRFKANR